ncbi:[Fe-Fe] hydrogenase large subunit C-terminal domain-containing protein [Halanaerobacter jeridensis]|uniref:PAS domain S-box-containing protein n=1 Tax=Halanaerobacter jeridensis TaxID=706427 RepID=A0A938XSZ0_9FIRM|nr:[Fe-Fe] hydrogenase large subunit C-terminal domain-containing protein [Halanaerobacter jeridensis]MBM7557264.1 PAS domain S-box-containing protein [Halanaerobacter jeridensis]
MGIIALSESDCEDCHRCVRNCSLKAIGIKNGQAEVVEEKCIYCGQCIDVCPQNAKEVSNQLTSLEQKLNNNKLVASLAPSFVAAFDAGPAQIVAGLKKLGFSAVEETAVGAEKIADYYQKLLEQRRKPVISACCPAVVNLIEKHYPDLISYLADSVSPMVAHGKLIQNKYDDAEVVFIGPCIAKLDEVTWQVAEEVDLAITFNQLEELFAKHNINLQQLKSSSFDDELSSWAASFPVQSGVLKAADIESTFNSEIITVSGLDECKNTFEDILAGEIEPQFVEAMICSGGCINGPGLSSESGVHARKEKIINYTKALKTEERAERKIDSDKIEINLKRDYKNKKETEEMPSENQIRSILSQLGKFNPEDELDCGGCGYDTCREKAIAVYQGYAENKMCIPYMKGKLESLADIIVKSSPNAIIVVDKDMIIQKFNPKANELFNFRKEYPIGNKLERYIDPEDFIKVWEDKRRISQKKVEYEQYDVVVEKSILPLADYELVVGILTDVTDRERQKEKVAEMKEETLEKANQVINKQMKVAQEIASLLGESTSETKVILHELRELMKEEGV